LTAVVVTPGNISSIARNNDGFDDDVIPTPFANRPAKVRAEDKSECRYQESNNERHRHQPPRLSFLPSTDR
jgi:hypothetical protein